MSRYQPPRLLAVLAGAIILTGVTALPLRAIEPRTAAIRGIFMPFQTDQASLAPDGKHLAFEKREGERLFLAIVDLETNHVVELPLMDDLATALSGVTEKVPTRITYLKWPTADRVVACIHDEVLIAADADGRNFKQLMGASELQFESGASRGAEMSTYTGFVIDQRTGRILETNTGRSVLYGPDGEPLNQGFDVPTVTKIGDEYRVEAKRGGGVIAGRIGEAGESATIDLFDSGSQAGPISALHPHVLGLLPDDPENVLVEIRGPVGPSDDVDVKSSPNLRSTVLKVNVRTGATKDHFEEFFTTRILCDKQGHPRAMLRQVGTVRTLRLAPKPGARFASYDKVLEGTPAQGLQIKPETLFGERSMPLGFDYNPDIFYYASNVGRDTYAIHAVDVAKKKDTGFVLEHPSLDFVSPSEMMPEDVLVFDRFRRVLVGARIESAKHETFWIDRELAALQRSMEEASKGMNVEILEWNEARTKFLVRVSEQSDPGAYFIYDATQKRIFEYVRRAPAIDPGQANISKPFSFTTPAGVKLTGYLTLPHTVRIEPLPVLVYCHDGPWGRDLPGYDRGAQALAAMGFAVLQVNFRGSAGFGRAHLMALHEQGEKAALDDIIATLDWIQTKEQMSRKRVAILGNGYGGYLALRAMQVYPERLRCAVSINAPTDLPRWLQDGDGAYSFSGGVRQAFFGEKGAALKAASPALNGQPIMGPVLIVQAQNDLLVPERHARQLRRALSNSAIPPEYLELQGEGHARWLPGSYVKVFDRLEEFFTTNIYNYHVEVGETKVVK